VNSIRGLGGAALAMAMWNSAWAAGPSEHGLEPPAVQALEVPEAGAVRLDGELTEASWRLAEPITEFVQREPDEGRAPSFRTEARVLYDATGLYIGVRAFDPEPSKIVGILTRRDEWSPSDWIRVVVDSYFDRRTAYEFAVNPAGVKQDKYWFSDQNSDQSWDAVWDVVVATDAEGWKAEFRIPFSQLRFDPRRGSRFGLAVVRQVGRLNETSTWPVLPRGANGYVSSFGDLTGLSFTRSSTSLELVPYTVGQVRTQPVETGNPLVNGTDPGASVGLDLKYALSPALTISGTINPDFGQVEADPAEVNLSAFETFFAERRPFFIEGAGIFRFDMDCNDGSCTGLFYSRRIGRSPQGKPDAPDAGYVASPTQTTILGAAKITGRMGGWSLGALNAVTGEETAALFEPGRRFSQPAEPLTSYTVVRLRREFDNQSSVGLMTTSTTRRIPENLRFLAGNAFTGGVDWDWRLSRSYAVTGYWAGSSVRGDPQAITRLQENNVHGFQRPDAPHVELDVTRTALSGHAGFASVGKIAGDRIRFNSNVGFKSPGFEVNDVGFQRRADQRTMSNWLQWRFDTPSKYLRTFRINFNQWAGWNFAGDRLYAGYNVNAHAFFQSNWSTGAGINLNHGGFDDRLTRGGPGGRTTARPGVWHYLNSDNRRPISFGYGMFLMRDRHGSSVVDVNPTVTIRPTPALFVSVGLRYNQNIDDAQWVGKVQEGRDRFVLAHLHQRTVSFTNRVNYTMTPNLSLQVYAEPFVSAGEYTDFRELVDGRAGRYEDRFAPFAYRDNPDFTFKSFRTTNVLRWEYKPGSTLFVVWQQNRQQRLSGEGRGDFAFGRDFGDIFAVPATNVFLVKLAYWLNF
jgi:hypothetical protein